MCVSNVSLNKAGSRPTAYETPNPSNGEIQSQTYGITIKRLPAKVGNIFSITLFIKRKKRIYVRGKTCYKRTQQNHWHETTTHKHRPLPWNNICKEAVQP